MEWRALLAAAALSAVVSWLTARYLAKRQLRATDHEGARRELRELLAPVRLRVKRYRFDMISGRSGERGHMDDAVLAGRVLAIADRLPRWRRFLVRRRLRRLVGPVWFDLGELHEPGDGWGAADAWLLSELAAVRAERRGEDVARTDDLGTLHRGLSGDRASIEARALERDLRRLSQAW